VSNFQLGVGTFEGPDGKAYASINATNENISIAITFTSEDSCEQDIDNIIDGLVNIKADLLRYKSGLIVAQEVPNGIRPAQGGQQPGQSSPRPPRPRQAKG
jgi:hypothetical protein